MNKNCLFLLKQGKMFLLLCILVVLVFLFLENRERERKIIYTGKAGEAKEEFLYRGAYESLEEKSDKNGEVYRKKEDSSSYEKKEESSKEAKTNPRELTEQENKVLQIDNNVTKSNIGNNETGENTEEAMTRESRDVQAIEKEETRKSKKININTASQAELESLKGIGPATAKNIIRYREEYGGFSSIEEIKNVKRIGDKIFDKIKEDICV